MRRESRLKNQVSMMHREVRLKKVSVYDAQRIKIKKARLEKSRLEKASFYYA